VLWRQYRQEGETQCLKWDRETATRIGRCLGRSEGSAMASEELLESEHWRIFRLFMSELSDEELEEIEEQLERERAARRERENSIVRLFYSAMCASDLEAAAEQLRTERKARAEDQRLARESECDTGSRATTASRKTASRKGATGKARRRATRSR
jgi:hypothetical protein